MNLEYKTNAEYYPENVCSLTNFPNASNCVPIYNSFPNAFNSLSRLSNNYDKKNVFTNNNFTNNGNLLHNNLNDKLLNEQVREYSILIDSKDRNYQIYPDPFNYEVKFNPLPKSREINRGVEYIYEEPAPVINDSFINVKYIKLECVILPFYNKIRKFKEIEDDETIHVWKVDTLKPITDNFYNVLSLGKEYTDINYRSTNDVLADSFATIYYDCKINNTHFMGYTSNGIKTFPNDQLAKIDRLKISFMDPYGYPLICDHVDKKIRSNTICTCDDPEGDDDTDCFKHNLRHPLNPIFQNHLHFKVGVIEARLDKKTFS